MKNIIITGFIVLFAFSCEKEDSGNKNFKLIDTLELSAGDCFNGFENTSICFDSVIYDSRCPEIAECFWEGNAAINIDMSVNKVKHSFILNTSYRFCVDTTIDFIYVSLLELSTKNEIDIKKSNYKAKLFIVDLNNIECNAQVISFNAEKCGCCWGWTIKMGNDTIKSDDGIIAQRVGYDFPQPVNVYIELGELEKTCTEAVGIDYYKLKQIIKTK